MIDEENDPYHLLAEAIIEGAIKDYLRSYKAKIDLKIKLMH